MRLAVILLALTLAACGGGSGGSNNGSGFGGGGATGSFDPPPAVHTLADYLPQLGTGRWHGILANPTGAFSTEFFTEPGRVRWGDSVEHWRVRDCLGVSYAWVDGYESVSAKAFYPVESVLDTVGDKDISSCADGAAFAPMVLDKPVTVQQWFRIWDATHTYWRPGYWRADFRPLPSQANPCQAGLSLAAVELREVWWDSAAGWVRGHPKTPGALPWSDADKNTNPVAWTSGSPLPIETVSTSVETFALHSGLWTITEGGGTICQASLTSW